MQSENEAGSVITILSMISLVNLSPALLANSSKTVPFIVNEMSLIMIYCQLMSLPINFFN